MPELSRRRVRVLYSIAAFGAITALAVFAWRGWYSRYLTDDYCTAATLQDLGFFQAMAWHREHWSGRFAYFPLKAAFEALGSWTARVTPALMIVLFVVVAFATLRSLTGRASRLPAASIALTFVFAVVAASPSLTNIGGSLYWETGSVTYLPPLMLFTLWLGLFAWQVPPRLAYVASGVVMFIAGGFSETSLAAQVAFAAVVLSLSVIAHHRHFARIAAIGLVASLIALYVVASAPGNAIRVEIEVVPRTPFEAVVGCFRLANGFIGTYFFSGFHTLLPMMLVAFICANQIRRGDQRTALSVTAAAICAYIAAFLPSAWLLKKGPPERALDVPGFFMIVALFALAWAAGLRVRKLTSRSPVAVAVAAILLLAVPLISIRENLEVLPLLRAVAKEADDTDRLLRNSRSQAVTRHAPLSVTNRIFHEDKDHWTSRCVSRYYELESFRVTRE